MQLLRTILIILLVYYGFKILSRLFAPYLMRYASRKMEEKFRAQQPGAHRQQPPYREGETVIDKAPQSNRTSKSSDEVGEYIEFEEVD